MRTLIELWYHNLELPWMVFRHCMFIHPQLHVRALQPQPILVKDQNPRPRELCRRLSTPQPLWRALLIDRMNCRMRRMVSGLCSEDLLHLSSRYYQKRASQSRSLSSLPPLQSNRLTRRYGRNVLQSCQSKAVLHGPNNLSPFLPPRPNIENL